MARRNRNKPAPSHDRQAAAASAPVARKARQRQARTRSSANLEHWFIGAMVAYFVIKSTYFAINIGPLIFPDEVTHFGRCVAFSKYLLIPPDSIDTYHLGPIADRAYLYYLLLGKALLLNVTPISDLLLLRMINVAIGALTLLIAFKWVKILNFSLQARILFAIVSTNTLMFTFNFGSVNYDNLLTLLSVASVASFSTYMITRHVRHILLLLAWLSMASLTKSSAIPFAASVVLILVYREWKNIRDLASKLRHYLIPLHTTPALHIALCLGTVLAAASLYGMSIARYGKLQPDATDVLTHEQAMANRSYARNYIAFQYIDDEITYEEAVARIPLISHAGDQAGCRMLLNSAKRDKLFNHPRIGRIDYAFMWTDMMMGRIYGVMAHQNMIREGLELYLFYAIFIFSVVKIIRNYRDSDMQGQAWMMLFMFLFYSVILMQLVNYSAYDRTGNTIVAVQGRYLFPVIVPAHAIIVWYLLCGYSKKVQWVLTAIVSTIFLIGEFPYFLQHVQPFWYR